MSSRKPPSSFASMYQGLDMYRKIPNDFLESTRRGSFLSIVALLTTVLLIYKETSSYVASSLVTDLKLDSDRVDPKLRINFNITMMDFKCDYVSVDAVSVFGTEQDVQRNVIKRAIDQDGVKQQYMSRNTAQRDIGSQHLFDPTITESHEDMLDRKKDSDIWNIVPDEFQNAIKDNTFVFVDYYASWCSHCRALMPTWESLAEIMNTATTEMAKHKMMEKQKELEEAAKKAGKNWTAEEFHHAEEEAFQIPVLIAKVDCVEYYQFCNEHRIGGYPTLRLFVDGEKHGGDYYGDRTVLHFTDYLATVEEDYLKKGGNVVKADGADTKSGLLTDVHEFATSKRKKAHRKGQEEQWAQYYDDDYYRVAPDDDGNVEVRKGQYRHKMHREWVNKDHPGCEVSGFLIVDRVPGNFHILAQSSTHDLVPTMTNVSHEVNHLSFGDPYLRRKISVGNVVDIPKDFDSKLSPMDGNVYMTQNLHEAYHHYLKIVSTDIIDYTRTGKTNKRVFQILSQSQLAYYKENVVPQAKFQYDLSPVSVTFRPKTRHWYDYATSLMAIVGGMFTVIGMIEGSIGVVSKQIQKKRY